MVPGLNLENPNSPEALWLAATVLQATSPTRPTDPPAVSPSSAARQLFSPSQAPAASPTPAAQNLNDAQQSMLLAILKKKAENAAAAAAAAQELPDEGHKPGHLNGLRSSRRSCGISYPSSSSCRVQYHNSSSCCGPSNASSTCNAHPTHPPNPRTVSSSNNSLPFPQPAAATAGKHQTIKQLTCAGTCAGYAPGSSATSSPTPE